jgi:hypothetical protein
VGSLVPVSQRSWLLGTPSSDAPSPGRSRGLSSRGFRLAAVSASTSTAAIYNSALMRHTQIANQLQRSDRPYDAGEEPGSIPRGQLYFAVTVAPS